MSVTADDINTALDAMEAKKERWANEHPNEKMPICPKCNNIGLYRRAFDEMGVELFGADMNKAGAYDYFYPCECVDIKDTRTKRNNRKFAAVASLYQDARFNNFDASIYTQMQSKQLASVAVKHAKVFVDRFESFERQGMGLYIYSESRGSGKSRLASTIGNELTERGIRCRYEPAHKILTEIQKSWSDNNVSEGKIIERYIEPRVLIIDDLGARSGKDWMDEKFFMIIDSRYQDNKVTICTSNYMIDELPFHDNRIMDRLSDVDRFHFIKMPQETVRTKSRTAGDGDDPFYKIAYGKEDTK